MDNELEKNNMSVYGECLDCHGRLVIIKTDLFDTRFGIPGHYTIARCNSCGLEQLSPLPSLGDLKLLYEAYYNFDGENNTAYTSLRYRFLFSPLYRLWMLLDGDISFHSKRGAGRLLDVGCNEGRGLAFYVKNGFSAEGLELNENAANVARSQGFIVHRQLVEHFEPPELFDVVVLSNVLEHSLEPAHMISHVKRLLKPGGEVWVSCPNCKSWLSSAFGRYWINWHVPFHVSHFSIETLGGLLQKKGFTVVRSEQYTPALWVAHSIISCFFAKRDKPTKQLRNPLLIILLISLIRGLFFPLLWLFNVMGFGDCLVATARINK